MGNVGIGGHYPVSIQSMTSTSTEDIDSTLDQIESLKEEGCDIVRVAVPDKTTLKPFSKILNESPLPIIADIHFDAYLAMQAMEMGTNGIRINPGNIGSKNKLIEILKLANQKKIPIRIGVNSGSIEKKYLKSNMSKSEAMVNSALDLIKFFEDNDFFLMKISIKSSDVKETIQAYRMLDKKCDYPLHLGITEAGTFIKGTVKSAIGIGSLLAEFVGHDLGTSGVGEQIASVRPHLFGSGDGCGHCPGAACAGVHSS